MSVGSRNTGSLYRLLVRFDPIIIIESVDSGTDVT